MQSDLGVLALDIANMHLTDPEQNIIVTNNANVESPVTAEARRPAQFTDLPVELKEKIYEYTLPVGFMFEVCTHCLPLHSVYKSLLPVYRHLPAVCFINKLERVIASSVFFRNVELFIDYYKQLPVLERWLTPGQSNLFGAVRKMEVSCAREDCYPMFDFACKCGKLKELRIGISLWKNNSIGNWQFSAGDNPQHPHLGRLYLCSELQSLTFIIYCSATLQDVEHSLLNTAASMRQMFSLRTGKALEVKVERIP
jgi:hypothetical protein